MKMNSVANTLNKTAQSILEIDKNYTLEPRNQTKSIRIFFIQNSKLKGAEEFQTTFIDIGSSEIETLLDTHKVIGIEPIKKEQRYIDIFEFEKNMTSRKLDNQENEVLKKLNSKELKKDIASYFNVNRGTLSRWVKNRELCINFAKKAEINFESISIVEIKQQIKTYYKNIPD